MNVRDHLPADAVYFPDPIESPDERSGYYEIPGYGQIVTLELDSGHDEWDLTIEGNPLTDDAVDELIAHLRAAQERRRELNRWATS